MQLSAAVAGLVYKTNVRRAGAVFLFVSRTSSPTVERFRIVFCEISTRIAVDMMFTIESILGDKLCASRSSADSQQQQRRKSQEICENDGKDAKVVSPLVHRRAEKKDSPPPLIPAAFAATTAAAETTAATLRSRASQPIAAAAEARRPPSVVVCRKRKSMSDGEDDISGENTNLIIT